MRTIEERLATIERMLNILPDGSMKKTVGKGKYANKTHEQVLELDPDYILWLDEKGLIAGFGFTDTQVAAARQRVAQNLPNTPNHPLGQQSTQVPW